MAATPRKRAKHDAAPARTFAEALARVRAQAAFVEQSVALAPGDAAEVQRELSVLNERITAFEKAINQSNGEAVGELAGWKDDLDAVGTSLWNRSTALKHVHDGHRDDKTWLAPFAARAHLGLHLRCLARLICPSSCSPSGRVSPHPHRCRRASQRCR